MGYHRNWYTKALDRMVKWIVLLLFCSSPVFGQIDSMATTATAKKTNTKDSSFFQLSNRPKKAFLLAAAIPTAGQIFNKSWWKVPIAAGIYGWSVVNYLGKQNRFEEFNGYFNTAVTENKSVEVRPGLLLNAKQIKFYRDKARDQRDVSIFLGIGLHLFVALEAYVNAHLKEFDISEDLSIITDKSHPGIGLAYKLH